MRRREFIGSGAGLALTAAALPGLSWAYPRAASARLKPSLNAFSFNDALLKGSMTLDELVAFCADQGFDGVDITAYYFKGYPAVPSNEMIFQVKRTAHKHGLEISGTGVRNDFTIPDRGKRLEQVDMVRKWIEVAARLGAPVLRIFAGTQKNEGIPRADVISWMTEDIRTCVEYGKQNGIVIGLQNHNDFLQTAEEHNKIVEAIGSQWLGLIIDTGSYRQEDPYKGIEKSVKYAVNWQIKEKTFVDGKEVETDVARVVEIIKASGYQGYLPIETLGDGDPKIKIPLLLERLRKALNG